MTAHVTVNEIQLLSTLPNDF